MTRLIDQVETILEYKPARELDHPKHENQIRVQDLKV